MSLDAPLGTSHHRGSRRHVEFFQCAQHEGLALTGRQIAERDLERIDRVQQRRTLVRCLGTRPRRLLDGIDAAFSAGARAILLCNPQNPTGAVATSSELAALADLTAAHEGWVLADEIHAPLALPGATHVPFLTVSPTARARGIALVSASKTFNLAGLGCAQIVTADEPARSAAAELPEGARHCGHLGAIASAAAYREGGAWLDSVIAVLAHNRELLGTLLAEPRGLLRELIAETELEAVGLEQVPHDLWAAADLPALRLDVLRRQLAGLGLGW